MGRNWPEISISLHSKAKSIPGTSLPNHTSPLLGGGAAGVHHGTGHNSHIRECDPADTLHPRPCCLSGTSSNPRASPADTDKSSQELGDKVVILISQHRKLLQAKARQGEI